ncbi:SpoIIE family protein phosphatase [Dactylosporangium sp. NPDC049525]|uniref:SpoIIE family protein phosphatase n=1 Tax=Dactylosporangium sp. NPDC049525 TaxID=3154730 RepID=UPI0034397DD5
MIDRVTELPPAPLLAVLDTDPQGWVLARSVRQDGRIVDFELLYINDAGCRIVNRSRAELIGGRYRRLWPETVHDGTLPLYCTVVESQQPVTRTVYYDRASLSGHFELSIAPYFDGFAVRFVDLREVTVSPRSVAGHRLYDVLDAAFDGFTLLRPVRDSAGEIVDFVCEYVNQIGAKLAGHSPEDVIGHRLSDISPDSWASGLFASYRTVAESGEPWRQHLTYPDVGQVWEIKIGRAEAGFVAVSFREITEQVEQRQQLAASSDSAQRAAARAEDAATRAAALQSVTTALVAASTITDIYTAISSVLRPSAGGQALALLLRDGERLRLYHHDGYEPDVVAQLRNLPLEHPYPATQVARTGLARFVTSAEEFHALQPDPRTAVGAGDRQAWALLPLAVAGEVLGTLVVGYHQPRAFDEADRAMLSTLAGLSAQALQRAMLYETRTSTAATLQRALLPATLPPLPGLRHAARYLPWTQGVDVGGDWYDVIALDDAVIGVVIGDVGGHNAAAAAAMGQVRTALRAYATERHNPAMIMHHANRLMHDMGLEAIATCCYLEIHLDEGTVTATLAGHPPPVLRTGGGAKTLDLCPGPPLGVEPNAMYRDTTFLLPADASLLLYTDGLVEDRRHPIDRGLHELCVAVRSAPTNDPAGILDHLLSSDVGPRPRTDDVALLCLTADRTPPDPARVQRRFRGDTINASAARRLAADMLTAWHQHHALDDALLLLDELITNAIQHTAGDVTVELNLTDHLEIAVIDSSNRAPARHNPAPDSESGRGLGIVEQLATAWGTQALPAGGKRVWFRLPAQPPNASA